MAHCNAVHNDVRIQNQLGGLTGSSEALSPALDEMQRFVPNHIQIYTNVFDCALQNLADV